MSCATTSSCLRLDRNTLSSLRMNHSQREQSVCRRRSAAPTIMPPCLVEDPAPDRQDFGDDVDLGRRPRSTNKIFSVQVLAGRSWPGRDRGRRSTAETASTPRHNPPPGPLMQGLLAPAASPALLLQAGVPQAAHWEFLPSFSNVHILQVHAGARCSWISSTNLMPPAAASELYVIQPSG